MRDVSQSAAVYFAHGDLGAPAAGFGGFGVVVGGALALPAAAPLTLGPRFFSVSNCPLATPAFWDVAFDFCAACADFCAAAFLARAAFCSDWLGVALLLADADLLLADDALLLDELPDDALLLEAAALLDDALLLDNSCTAALADDALLLDDSCLARLCVLLADRRSRYTE